MNNLRQRLGLLMSLAVLILLAAGCFNAPFDLIGGGDPPGGNGNGHEPAVYDGSACTGALGTVEDVLSCYAQYGTQSDWENFASLYSFPLVFVATLQLDEDSDIGGDELQAASTRQEVEAIPWSDILGELFDFITEAFDLSGEDLEFVGVTVNDIREIDGAFEVDLASELLIKTAKAGRNLLPFFTLDASDDERVIDSVTLVETSRSGTTVHVEAKVEFDEGRTTCSDNRLTIENKNGRLAITVHKHQEMTCTF